jgi:hypothetical protein
VAVALSHCGWCEWRQVLSCWIDPDVRSVRVLTHPSLSPTSASPPPPTQSPLLQAVGGARAPAPPLNPPLVSASSLPAPLPAPWALSPASALLAPQLSAPFYGGAADLGAAAAAAPRPPKRQRAASWPAVEEALLWDGGACPPFSPTAHAAAAPLAFDPMAGSSAGATAAATAVLEPPLLNSPLLLGDCPPWEPAAHAQLTAMLLDEEYIA